MNHDDVPRAYVALGTQAFVECPLQMPELVQMDDPAIHVFSDFTHNRPPIITGNVSIDVAMNKMKKKGVHLLLVIDHEATDSDKRTEKVIGQITACDILGEVPVKLTQTNGINHHEITVDMVMTPRKDTQVLEWSTIKVAKVGHIIETMHQQECCHILGVEDGRLRGIFSMSEISRHLGHDESEPLTCAHSLAELVHTIG